MKMKSYDRERFNELPDDVKAILDLFPDLSLAIGSSGDWFDVHDEAMYKFIQPIPGREHSAGLEPTVSHAITPQINRRRFVSWVRAGMPEGYDYYDNVWTKED